MNALSRKYSIFEEVKIENFPIKPVGGDQYFDELSRPALSGEGINSRISQAFEKGNASSGTHSPNSSNVAVDTITESRASVLSNQRVRKMLDGLPSALAPVFFTSTFSPLQEWEGYVRSIGNESIVADLVDVTALESGITEKAEIPFDELYDSDRERLRIGAVFGWSMGYQRTTTGTKMRVSNIVFRDLPRWTQKDIREAKAEAAKLSEYFRSGRSKITESY
jgi:hypothetical protein